MKKDGVLLFMKIDGVLLLMKKVRNLNEQFHLQMCLVYSSSEFYNTTDRIIVLMQVFPSLSLLWCFELCLVGDLQPPDRHGP